MESNLRRSIYNQVSQHVDIGDYDNFSKAMDDPARRKNFHNAVSDYVDMGDFDKFDTAIKNDPQVKFWDNFNKSVMGTDLQESGNTPESLKAWADYGGKVEDEKEAQKQKQKDATDKQHSLLRNLFLQPQAEKLNEAAAEVSKGGAGNVTGGIGKGLMSFVDLVGAPFGIADAAIRKIPFVGEGLANAAAVPFQASAALTEAIPNWITSGVEASGAGSKLREMFPNFRIDPKTAAAIKEPIQEAVDFGGQVLMGKAFHDLSSGLKEKAGIPSNLKEMMNESSAAGQRLMDPTRNDFGNWNAPDNPPAAKPFYEDINNLSNVAQKIVHGQKLDVNDLQFQKNFPDELENEIKKVSGKQKQLRSPSDFHVNPDGTVSRGIDDLKDLKSEREGLVNELHILRSKLNLSENPATQKKLQGFIDDRMERINTIDKTISPGKKTSPLTSLDNTTAKPIDEHLTGEDIQNLPPAIADKMKGTADNLQSELKNASVDRSGSYGTYENNGEGYTTTRSQKGFTVNYFPKWFSDLGRGKEDVIAALQKIKEDAGKDRGKLVEDLKNEIIERLKGNHEDVLRMNVGGVDHTENMGAIPGDPEISDFINSIDKNLTLQQLHDEYQAFEDASKFEPEMFSNKEPGTPEKVQNSVGSEAKNASGQTQVKEPYSSSAEVKISSPGLNADKSTISEKVNEKVPIRTKARQIRNADMPLERKQTNQSPENANEGTKQTNLKPESKELYKKVLNQYAKGGTLNSADLGEYANEKLPTTELFKRIKDLGLTEDVKDIQKRINSTDDINLDSKAQDYERIARIALKQAEAVKEPGADLFGNETKEPAAKSTKKTVAAEDDMFSPEMKKTQVPEAPVDKGKAAKADESTPLFKKETPKDKNQGSLELQSTVMPGLKQFAEEDLTPAVEKAVGGIKAMLNEAQKKFAPATRGEFAKATASILRKNIGAMVHKNEMLNDHFNDVSKFFKKQDPKINTQRILEAENGIYNGTAAEKSAMKSMQEQLNKTYSYIVDTYKDGAGKFIENYFPHFWEDPKKAADVWAKTLSKRSLSGTRGFLKERKLPTIQEGLDLGLKLATDNPVELFQLKMAEMNKYIMAMDSWKEFKDSKLLKFQRVGSKMLDGYAKLSDRMGTVFGNPNIPVTEYFDELKRDKLEELVSGLGADHERKMSLGRQGAGAMGYFKSPNEIKTKFATPLGTLTHELGHYIDQQYHLADQFVKNKKFAQELRDLADLRYEGHDPADVSSSYKSYVRKAPEKMANMIDAYVNAPNKFKNVAPNTYAALKSFIDDHSELHGLNDIEDSLTRTGETKTVNAGGMLIHGYWTMPEQAATIVNNYLSPGLQGNVYYDMFRKSANTLNSVQLGISGFHALFTGMDAMTSKMSLGFEQLKQGRLLEGGSNIVQGVLPTTVLTNLMQGKRLREAYYGKNPELWQYVKDLESADARVKMDSFFQNNSVENWLKAWRTGNWVGGAIRTPGALIETMAKPLMEHFVPLQKLGVFMDMAKNIHDEANVKGWDGDEVQTRMQKAWDSVDNRMGQLTYDNLFWDRSLKDLGMASVRSLGWNIGDIRELGGAPVDLIKQIKSAATGQGFELTHKMAYAMALPVVTGLYGALTQYMFTGSGPTSMKDYFFPKTGNKTPDGNDERISLPSYMKDIWAYGTHPISTITNKLQPLGSAIIDMLKNEDYYGYEINDKNFEDSTKKLFEKGDASDLGEGLMNEIKYIGKQFVPFSVQGAMQRKRSGATAEGMVPAFFGLNPSPKYITNTSAQNEIEDTYKQRFSGSVKHKNQEDVDQAKRDIRDALKLKDKGKAQQLINDAVDKGYFEENSQTVKNMMKASNQSFDRFAFGRLPSYDQSAMLDKWNDEDINRYLPYASKDVFKENPELIEKAKSLRDDLLKQIDDLQHSDNPDPEKITPLQKEVAALSKHVGKGTGVNISKDIKGQTVITRRRFGTPDSTGVTTQ